MHFRWFRSGFFVYYKDEKGELEDITLLDYSSFIQYKNNSIKGKTAI